MKDTVRSKWVRLAYAAQKAEWDRVYKETHDSEKARGAASDAFAEIMEGEGNGDFNLIEEN